MESPVTVPRWRRITFYVVSALMLLMLVGMLWPLLIFVVIAWLPVESLQEVLATLFPGEEVGAVAPHRIHWISMGLIFWGLTIGAGLQLRKPERRQAAMLVALAVVVGFLVIDPISGSFDPEAVPIMAGVGLMALLHPARHRLFRFRPLDRGLGGLAILAAIPGAFLVIGHIALQRANTPGDTHAEVAHWSAMAVFMAMIVLWGLIGSTGQTGWRLSAWLAGISAAAFGVASLVFPTTSSALGAGWAVAAIAWGAVYVALAARRTRSQSETSKNESVTQPVISESGSA